MLGNLWKHLKFTELLFVKRMKDMKQNLHDVYAVYIYTGLSPVLPRLNAIEGKQFSKGMH